MAINSSALAQAFYNCREVSPSCPVEATVLGYYPNLGVNATLATGFGACAVITAWLGLWKKTWPFALAVVVGCLLEFTGVCHLSFSCVFRVSSTPAFVLSSDLSASTLCNEVDKIQGTSVAF
jgi:hypothetical protein